VNTGGARADGVYPTIFCFWGLFAVLPSIPFFYFGGGLSLFLCGFIFFFRILGCFPQGKYFWRGQAAGGFQLGEYIIKGGLLRQTSQKRKRWKY
jgi:hypothetical protein